MSNPYTLICLDSNSKFEIFISKQKILEFLKYFEKAAAEEPAKDPISRILIFLFLR